MPDWVDSQITLWHVNKINPHKTDRYLKKSSAGKPRFGGSINKDGRRARCSLVAAAFWTQAQSGYNKKLTRQGSPSRSAHCPSSRHCYKRVSLWQRVRVSRPASCSTPGALEVVPRVPKWHTPWAAPFGGGGRHWDQKRGWRLTRNFNAPNFCCLGYFHH